MKLDIITRENVIEAASEIDMKGIPENNIYNMHWVSIQGKEYPFRYLTTLALKKADSENVTKPDFQTNKTYLNYIRNLGFPIQFYKEDINFFNVPDIEHFEKIGETDYRKDNSSDVNNGNILKHLVYKTNVWARMTVIENFVVQEDKTWQWSGMFKPYLWIRSFRPEDTKKVFFIVGVSSGNDDDNQGFLYCALECLRVPTKKVGKLTQEEQDRFDNYLRRSEYKELRISKADLKDYTWDRLIQVTTDFFYTYASLYDELENMINDKPTAKNKVDGIIYVEAPKGTKSHLNKNRTFKGVIIDWAKRHFTSKKLGTAGEEFIISCERKKLIDNELFDLADKVKPMLDGEGFDVLSYDLAGNEIHIEVKTTSGGINEPFYFSINEKEYLEKHPENYYLHRLHEFRVSPPHGKCYILTAKELRKSANFNATNFEVSLS